MNKTDFAELKEKLTKLDDELAIKKQFEKEVTEYRYAVYPDADKDQIQTMLADCGCHGYFDAAFIGVKAEHTKSAAIISELIEIISLQNKEVESYARYIYCTENCKLSTSWSDHAKCTCGAEKLKNSVKAALSETTTRLQKLREGNSNGK